MVHLLGSDINLWHILTIVALACGTVVARSFFFISSKPWSLPGWAERGLQYAPIAALCAVIAPEIVISQGALIHTFKDARIYGLAGGMLFYFARRGSAQAVLGTIAAGMLCYLPLHIGLGW